MTIPEEIATLWQRKATIPSYVLFINRYARLIADMSLATQLLPVYGSTLTNSVRLLLLQIPLLQLDILFALEVIITFS